MSKELNIQPTLKAIFEGFKDYGYSYSTALSEFLDNSISSFRDNSELLNKYKEKGLDFEKTIIIIFDKKSNRIIIRDSAFGIDEEDFERSLKMGKKKGEKNSLNEFAKGLKTAAFWFGKNLNIKTRSYNDLRSKKTYSSGAEFGIKWTDIESGHPTVTPKKIDAVSTRWGLQHGVVIEVSDIYPNRLPNLSEVKGIIKSIASKYRRDILNEGLEIFVYYLGKESMYHQKVLDVNKFVNNSGKDKEKCLLSIKKIRNGVPLTYAETKKHILKDGNENTFKVDFKFIFNNRRYYVDGEFFQREKGSRPEAGIDLYRRGRIVQEKFKGFFPSAGGYEYQRINGFLNLDSFDITQTKDKILWDGSLFEEVKKRLFALKGFKEFRKYVDDWRERAQPPSENQMKKIVKEINDENIENEALTIKAVSKKIIDEDTIVGGLDKSDVVYEVKTENFKEKIVVISRMVLDNSMKSWLEISDVKTKDGQNATLVSFDITHIFFNPFNSLRENGKTGQNFIKTMRKFSIYWGIAEKTCLRCNSQDFRKHLSMIIERNKNDNN